MFPSGARNAKVREAKRRARTVGGAIRGIVRADPAKMLVLNCVRLLVADGQAEWARRENGDIHLRLRSGETFLLADATITRIG
jgi:hypothetical protein